MNVIVNGNVHEGEKLEMIEDHLFLDGTDIGKVDSNKFQARTIKGEVYMAQWEILEGGVNV